MTTDHPEHYSTPADEARVKDLPRQDDAYRYRTTWEMVSPFANDGAFYSGDHPAVPPEMVSDQFWSSHQVEHDGDAARMDQYRTLSEWARTGSQLVRNVRMQRAPRETGWTDFTPERAS